ncbi:MAG: hypothetical protein WC082_14735 [Victivallales bacterium]
MKDSVKLVLGLIIGLVFGMSVFGQQTMIDRAVSNAADKTINELSASPQTAGIKNIAFLGLKSDKAYYSSLFRSALAKSSGRFSFYTRDEKLWDRLVQEIEFGERREDIMRRESIQKFGRVEGVQALMYGKVLEAKVDNNGNAEFRVSLLLAEVETGRFIWGGVIGGHARKIVETEAVPYDILQAAIDAGKKLNDDLMLKKAALPEANVFILPFLGQGGSALYDAVSSQLVQNFDSKIHFYANPDKLDVAQLDDIQSDIKGNLPTYTSKQLTEIMNKLQKAYNINPKAVSGGKYGKDRVNAYLQGIVTGCHIDRLTKARMLSLNVQLRDFSNNRLLWSANVTGEYQAPASADEQLRGFWERNRMWLTVTGGIIAVFVLIIFMFGTVRLMTRPR